MGRQAGAFRAHIVARYIADDGGDVSGGNGIQLVLVDAARFVNPVLTGGDDGVQVYLVRRCYALQRTFGIWFCNWSASGAHVVPSVHQRRSEERRVGKECRSRWSPY